LRGSYATRQATGTWKTLIGNIVDVNRRQVADIGCGGGIYAKALLEMGAEHITCIDSSETMLADARSKLKAHHNVEFLQGDALHTGAQDQQFHIVLERALIHHLRAEELRDCFAEALRILKPGSTLIVQDRTPEDCLLPGSETHIRGYFFARYPRLGQIEVARRHTNTTVQNALREAGFRVIEKRQLWETRQLYTDFSTLASDLKARTGRSILHELSDDELQDLITYIHSQLESDTQSIVEQDRWTIWSALR
jgi:ubiquinone/menaquinone biosynthesis C-methylase UbiE